MATEEVSTSPAHSTDAEKGFDEKSGPHYTAAATNLNHGRIKGLETDPGHSLHRGLKARHITMIALGGAIGTGLIIGTGSALANSGPVSLLLGYLLIGFVVFLVMAALGEMAAWLPTSGGFTNYASRYCSPSLGFALGWVYLGKYLVTTPNQLTAGALVITYWVPRTTLNPGVFITIFLVLIIVFNLLGIKFFGELEFWLSSFKVLVITGVIILSLVLAMGAGPDDVRVGFTLWRDPGAFKPQYASGSTGRFLGFWSVFVNAVFAFLGTELVGVTVAEAQNPRRTVPRAIKLTFYRILFFYILSVFLVGLLVPYNSRELSFAVNATTSANASPFVVAIKLCRIPVLDHILNACILLFVFSASNSDLYIASRTLYALSSDGSAPRFFSRTNRYGTPYVALGTSALVCCIAYLNVADDSRRVFVYLVNTVTIMGLLAWISILVTHIYFVRARRAQGVDDSQMPYVAPFGIWGSYGALFVSVLVALTKNYGAFVHNYKPGGYGKFDYKTFITGYIGIPFYLILLFGHKFWFKTKSFKPHETDLFTGKDIIDREEEDFLRLKAEKEAAEGPQQGWAKIYKSYVSWLF